jgi:hypothetical protein
MTSLRHTWLHINYFWFHGYQFSLSASGPQFLYCDVIFSKSSARLRECLKLAFNSCYRYISTYTNRILGVPLNVYWFYSIRICCMINNIIKSGGPRYLLDELRFGQSSRLFNRLVPAHTAQFECSCLLVLCSGYNLVEWPATGQPSKEEGAWGSFGWSVCHLGRSASNSN